MTGVPVAGPTEVRADNQAALAIVEKPSTVHAHSRPLSLHSRPGHPWNSQVHVDFFGDESGRRFAEALRRLAFEKCIEQLMVIGGVVGTVTEEE